MRKVFNIVVLLAIVSFLCAFALPPKKIRVYLIGDSTIADKAPDKFPETGWGTPFKTFFDSTVTIENRAKNGRSTRTFIAENLWQPIADALREGDYVFIQFGHNDEAKEKTDRYTSPEDYKSNLRKFVTETRAKNATPVLLTPVTRRRFKDGNIQETHVEYSKLVMEVGDELKVPVIDLDTRSRAMLQQVGEEASKLFFLQLQAGEHPNYPDGKNDNTHFSELGARKVAQLVLADIVALKLELSRRIIKPTVKTLTQGQTIAFPGAEGFGKYATGGRGGVMYVVTNLNDNGPGSFREAVKKKGPRIITFAVSGNIELESPLLITSGDVTIAGQTAPGDGICLKNFPLTVKSNNVIIRFMRFRLGNERSSESDALGGTSQDNIMIDHCSVSWSTDECASFYRNSNFTMQWCIVSESLNESVHKKGAHGYGGIWGGEKATFHHNLIASHNSRLPRFSGSASTPNNPEKELVDFRNNVIYNWMSNNTYGGERGKYNIINNYYKPGPATNKSRLGQIVNPSASYGKFFIEGNCLHDNSVVSKDNWKGVKMEHSLDSAKASKIFEVEPVSTQSAEDAFESVLKYAGASYRRDAVDQRVVSEVKTGKSSMGKLKIGIIDSQKDVGGWPVLNSTAREKDSDSDGIPDAWEIANKLKAMDASDGSGNFAGTQYTNVEVYFNEMVKDLYGAQQ